MKILQVIPYFVPAWDYGGPLRVAYGLAREMVRQGHEVTVETTDAGGAGRIGPPEEIIDGIRVRRYRNLSQRLARNYKIFLAPGTAGGEESFDIIHLHEFQTLQNCRWRRRAVRAGIPYVLQPHGSLPLGEERQALKKAFRTVWGRGLLRDAARLIALSETEAADCRSLGVAAERIEIVPNGVDLDEYREPPPTGQLRAELGLRPDQPLALYLGRIHQTKGIELLIRAFQRLNDNARLVIAGPDDGYLAPLRRAAGEAGISDRVIFTGPLYGDLKRAAYRDADVFVTPSFSGFPITFMEACASGTPIVTTERGDRFDWLDGRVGYVTAYDADSLARAIGRILSDPATAARFGEAGRALVRERFNWRAIAGEVTGLYARLMEETPARSLAREGAAEGSLL